MNSFGLEKVSVYDREAANAQDTSSTESAMIEYIAHAGLNDGDVFVLIQATSPLTQSGDIDAALRLFLDGDYDSLLSCSRTKRFFWNDDGTPANYDYTARPRRQDFTGSLMENGAFYISTVNAIRESQCRLSGKIAVYEMPEYCGIELDEPEDWGILEGLMRRYVLKDSRPAIKLLAMDVDGVLTDGGMYYAEDGNELKRFNTIDGKGIELVRNAGIRTAIITSENMKLNARRGQKLKIDFVLQGVQDKLRAMLELCRELKIDMNNTAYIGDDVNDSVLLENAGLSACPANAVDAVKDIPGILRLKHSGGYGAVREFCDYILGA